MTPDPVDSLQDLRTASCRPLDVALLDLVSCSLLFFCLTSFLLFSLSVCSHTVLQETSYRWHASRSFETLSLSILVVQLQVYIDIVRCIEQLIKMLIN